MSKFQNHFSPRKKSFFDPIFFLVKNMYLDFTIKAVRKRFAQMVHFRSTIPRNLDLASFIQCGLPIDCSTLVISHRRFHWKCEVWALIDRRRNTPKSQNTLKSSKINLERFPEAHAPIWSRKTGVCQTLTLFFAKILEFASGKLPILCSQLLRGYMLSDAQISFL